MFHKDVTPLTRQQTLAKDLEAAVANAMVRGMSFTAPSLGDPSSTMQLSSSKSLAPSTPMQGGALSAALALAPDPYDGPLPPGVTGEEWTSDMWKTALDRRGILEDQLLFPEQVEEQVAKLARLFEERRIDQKEYDEKCKSYTGANSDGVGEAFARMKRQRDALVDKVREEIKFIIEENSKSIPCPRMLTEDEFRSEFFLKACKQMATTLEQVSKPTKARQELDRMQTLVANERFTTEEIEPKVKELLGCEWLDAEDVLMRQLRANDELCDKLLKLANEIQKDEEKRKKQAEEEKKRRRQMIDSMAAQIDRAIEAEERGAKKDLARRRMQLEDLLIQKGVAERLKQLEEVEDNTTAHAHIVKKEPTWQHVPLVTRSRAAKERRNMFMRLRARQPEPPPLYEEKKKGTAPKMLQRTESGGVLTRERESKDATLRLVNLVKAREEDMRLRAKQVHESKLERAQRRKEEVDGDRKRRMELMKLRAPDRVVIQSRVNSLREAKARDVHRKLLADDERILTMKTFKGEQRRLIEEMQKKSKVQEDAVRDFMRRAKGGETVTTQMASELGIEIDQDRVAVMIQQLTEGLTQPPSAIVIPKVDRRGLFEAPPSHKDLFSRVVPRPQSAPPTSPGAGEGGHAPGKHGSGRPSSAMMTTKRPSPSKPSGKVLHKEDPVCAMEVMREEHAASLLTIVRAEREREAERGAMLDAVLPSRRRTLELLFEKERRKASKNILKIASDNEVIILNEMAKLGGRTVPT